MNSKCRCATCSPEYQSGSWWCCQNIFPDIHQSRRLMHNTAFGLRRLQPNHTTIYRWKAQNEQEIHAIAQGLSRSVWNLTQPPPRASLLSHPFFRWNLFYPLHCCTWAVYKNSFFPRTAVDSNNLLLSLKQKPSQILYTRAYKATFNRPRSMSLRQ